MASIITTTISMVPNVFSLLMARKGRAKPAGKPPGLTPPRVLANLPEVEKVDIRALLKKWDE